MRRCLACSATFPCAGGAASAGGDERCPRCGEAPGRQGGFDAWAPALAHGGSGFSARHFEELAAIEGEHFWFRARNELILWALGAYAPGVRSMLEIGCGTGHVLSAVAARFPGLALCGSELFVAGLAHAAARLPGVRLLQMDARHIPYVEEFQVIGAFDVLEHVAEDAAVLRQVHQALTRDGLLLLTVPQHASLWSVMDDVSCHVRRYSAAELTRKLTGAGFEILRSTSFVSLLLPAMYVARRLRRRVDPAPALADELKVPRALNPLLYNVLRVERALIRRGLDFPIGGSRLVVSRKVA